MFELKNFDYSQAKSSVDTNATTVYRRTSFLALLSSKILSRKADTCLGFRRLATPAPSPLANGGNDSAAATPSSPLASLLRSTPPRSLLAPFRYSPSAAAASAEEDLLGLESPRLLTILKGHRRRRTYAVVGK